MSGELLCRKLEAAAAIEEADLFIAPHAVDVERAAEVAQRTILAGLLRPEDAHTAKVEPPILAYVPFWRLEVAVDGMHVGFPVSVSTGSRSIPVPMPGYRHRESVSLIIARRLFPYPPNHVERTRGTVFRGSTRHGGWRGIEIQLDDMQPFAKRKACAVDAEIVDPDVTRARAERQACQRAQHSARPNNAIYTRYDQEVRSAACCYYPLYVVRYAYSGHAAKDPGSSYWVTVCGRTGEAVGGQHPSALRSVARKVRKWMTFG